MDLSESFIEKGRYSERMFAVPSSHRRLEEVRARGRILKRAATCAYILLQFAIIGGLVAICITPFWMRCHFFILKQERINGSSPDFHNIQSQDPFSVVFSDLATILQDALPATTTTTTKTTMELQTESSDVNETVTSKRRRMPPPPFIDPDEAMPNDVARVLNNTSSSSKGSNYSTIQVIRRYVTANIGLWQTCQLGECHSYASIWKMLVEFTTANWWLFICRWICIGGIGSTEVLWLLIAIGRYLTSSRRRRSSRTITYQQHLKPEDVMDYSREPIAGAALILLKLVTLLCTFAALVTFRWHTNYQWPMVWREKHGVIAHQGASWLGMIALGSCDVWLFFVTVLHTIAEKRDLKRAMDSLRLDTIRNGGNIFSATAKAARRPSRPRRRNHRGYLHTSGHAAPATSDDDSYMYSPMSSNNYRPTPYDDDCGFNTVPPRKHMSKQEEARGITKNYYQQVPSKRSLSGALSTPDITESPSYAPHFDDEAIGGRAFY